MITVYQCSFILVLLMLLYYDVWMILLILIFINGVVHNHYPAPLILSVCDDHFYTLLCWYNPLSNLEIILQFLYRYSVH